MLVRPYIKTPRKTGMGSSMVKTQLTRPKKPPTNIHSQPCELRLAMR